MGLGPRSLGPWVTMWRTATPHLHTDLRAGSELLCIKPLLVGFCCDSNSLTQICTESPKAPTRISIWMAFWFFGHTSTGTVFLCQKPFIFPTSHWVLHSAPPFPDTSWIALGNSSPSFSATQSIQVCRQLSMADCFQGSLGREKEVRKLFHWVLKVGVWALCGVRGGVEDSWCQTLPNSSVFFHLKHLCFPAAPESIWHEGSRNHETLWVTKEKRYWILAWKRYWNKEMPPSYKDISYNTENIANIL